MGQAKCTRETIGLQSENQMQKQVHRRLLEITPTDSEELAAAWRATAESRLAALSATPAALAACRPIPHFLRYFVLRAEGLRGCEKSFSHQLDSILAKLSITDDA